MPEIILCEKCGADLFSNINQNEGSAIATIRPCKRCECNWQKEITKSYHKGKLEGRTLRERDAIIG